jgi:hypothetical protein
MMSFRSLLGRCATWNHKLHIYIGLYLLSFVGFYAISGLVLNHPKWEFTQFWPNRRESTAEFPVTKPVAPNDLAKAQDLMGQLDLSGDINQVIAKADSFEFRVSKPGAMVTVTLSATGDRATVKQVKLNVWGVLNSLHHLTGVQRDGLPTRCRPATWSWSLLMDATSIGLLLLVVGGLWMWYQRPVSRALGLIALVMGVLCCGFFLFCL